MTNSISQNKRQAKRPDPHDAWRGSLAIEYAFSIAPRTDQDIRWEHPPFESSLFAPLLQHGFVRVVLAWTGRPRVERMGGEGFGLAQDGPEL